MTSNRSGFTIVELLVAMVILTVGLLALLGSSALDTRAIMRERNIDLAAIFAARRLELLRMTACTNQNAGADTLMKGSVIMATNTWAINRTFSNPGLVFNGATITLANRYFKAPTRLYGDTRGYSVVAYRTDSLETAVTCGN